MRADIITPMNHFFLTLCLMGFLKAAPAKESYNIDSLNPQSWWPKV
jgi:hypothetical protein